MSSLVSIRVRKTLALERARDLDVVVFDKTGTLTRGAPALSGAVVAYGVREDDLFASAAAVESDSEHPLAKVIVAEAKRRRLPSLAKYNLIRNFFEYWVARDEVGTAPMPPMRPACPQTFVPYIYSRTELLALLKGTRRSQKTYSCSIDARTFRMLLLFLYSTGALVGEALGLSGNDVNLRSDTITIRGGRFNRVRHIPIGQDLHTRLHRYIEWKSRWRKPGSNLFTNKDGSAIRRDILDKSFQRLRLLTGIRRNDGACYQPRMHDLRHTFAVHRLRAWLKHGAAMNRLLPALSAYMGQVGLGQTERYLSMTPERFRKQLAMLSPRRRKKRWRDNPALMRFLESSPGACD